MKQIRPNIVKLVYTPQAVRSLPQGTSKELPQRLEESEKSIWVGVHLTKVIGRFALKVDRSFFSANGSFRTTGNLGSTKVFQSDMIPTTIMRKTV